MILSKTTLIPPGIPEVGDEWRESVPLDRRFVQKWATAYEREEMSPGCLEDHLLTIVGPEAKRRGHLARHEVEQIGTWKSRGRNNHQLKSNTDADIEALTGMALSAPDHLRHCVLSILDGVRSPMASAILTVVDPDRFTVIDVRVIGAFDELRRLGLVGPTVLLHKEMRLPPYFGYLECCRTMTAGLKVDLRTLDRALWKWNQAGMPWP
jgi:hypothetical protein